MDIKLPAGIPSLIEEFVRERRYVPDAAVAVRSSEDLPAGLRSRIQDLPPDAQWCAWGHECQIWFIVAQWVREPHEETREVILKMTFHDQDGARAASGAWVRQLSGKWLLHSVPADPGQDDASSPRRATACTHAVRTDDNRALDDDTAITLAAGAKVRTERNLPSPTTTSTRRR